MTSGEPEVQVPLRRVQQENSLYTHTFSLRCMSLVGPFNKTIKQFENDIFPLNFLDGKLFLFL